MPNFNENNIGFTKFCQENLKSHENMLQKYLCPMAFCTDPYCLVPIAWSLRGEVLFLIQLITTYKLEFLFCN